MCYIWMLPSLFSDGKESSTTRSLRGISARTHHLSMNPESRSTCWPAARAKLEEKHFCKPGTHCSIPRTLQLPSCHQQAVGGDKLVGEQRGQLSALHCSTGPAGFPMASTIFNKHSRMSMCSVLHSPMLLPLSLHNLENLPNALMELRTQTTSGQNSQASFFLLPFEPCKWTFKSL